MEIKMVSISAVALFYASLALTNAPVVDISQQISGQDASAATATQTNDTPDASASMASMTVPVTPIENPVPPTMLTVTDLTESQRLERLEQQMNNITNMNLPQQISDLQQQLAQIRGQLEVQKHNLQLLNNQQRSLYQDLDQRITQFKNLNSGDISNGNSSSRKSSANSVSGSENIQLQDANTYRAALDLLTKKQYDKAKAAFQNYLDDYPNGNYVANAHYWLGEVYLQQKNTHKATAEFQVVRDKFPKSEKMLDAKLKLAIIHAEMGKISEAKRELMEIKKQHPESTVAQLANIRLQQLGAAISTSTAP